MSCGRTHAVFARDARDSEFNEPVDKLLASTILSPLRARASRRLIPGNYGFADEANGYLERTRRDLTSRMSTLPYPTRRIFRTYKLVLALKREKASLTRLREHG